MGSNQSDKWGVAKSGRWVKRIIHSLSLSESNTVKKCSRRNVEWRDVWRWGVGDSVE